MTKTGKTLLLVLVILGLLSLGAELALGCFVYTRLRISNDTLTELRTQNDALRSELSGLRAELSTLQQTLTDAHTAITALSDAACNEDPGQEDGVRIAGAYTIQSTLPISDAYRSGDRSALSDREKETLDLAAAVLDEIITPGMEPYAQELAVYSWMTHHLSHDEGLLPVIPRTQADCDNPYGVLKYHNAVCVGYATTFRLFMQMLGIPCMVVHNTERYHTWNLVRLGDGWYHTDVYADAGQGNCSHFNMTDAACGADQSWNSDYFPPADRFEYCYAWRISTEETDLYHVPAAIRAAVDQHDGTLALRFPDPDFGEREAQIVQQMLCEIQQRVNESTLNASLYLDWNWISLDEGWLLSVALRWYDEGGEAAPEIPEDAYEKMNEAIDHAFGDLEPAEVYWSWEESDDA